MAVHTGLGLEYRESKMTAGTLRFPGLRISGLNEPSRASEQRWPDIGLGDFGQVTKTKSLNNVRLYRCGLLIDGVGAKRRTDHGAGWPTALRMSYELSDCLGHVMRVRRICRLELLGKGLKHRSGDRAHFSVSLAAAPVCRKMNVRKQVRGIRARLNQSDIDSELRNLIPQAVGERFDCELAGTIDTEERERHSTKD